MMLARDDPARALQWAALIENGVPADAIELAEGESASVDRGLSLARPNDLLLIFCDSITRSWKQIIYFRPAEAPKPVPPERLVAAAGFDVPEGYRVLSDERGVRVVPEEAAAQLVPEG